MLYRLIANGNITIGYYENLELAETRAVRMHESHPGWEFAIALEWQL